MRFKKRITKRVPRKVKKEFKGYLPVDHYEYCNYYEEYKKIIQLSIKKQYNYE